MSTFRRRMMMKAKEQQSSVGEWDYFTIVAGESPVNMEITPYVFYNESDGTDGYVETSYSIDGGEWVDFSDWLPLTIPPQSRVRFCSNVQNYEMIEVACQFVSVDNFSIDGTVMSLLYGHEFNGHYEIPANVLFGVLAFYDQEVFSPSSSGLTRILNLETFLPAIILTRNCYANMFRLCTLLSEAPELPATTLAESCYKEMFNGCTNLNYIKMLATDISADECLFGWVSGVSPTGTFVKSKDATWSVVGYSGVPESWMIITDDKIVEFGQETTFFDAEMGESFTFVFGMTWRDFIDSEYNTGDYNVGEYGFGSTLEYIANGFGSIVGYKNANGGYTDVRPETLITPNGIYNN